MKPGLYPNLSEDAYFASEGVNNSLLKIGAKSWKQAHHYQTGPREKPTPAMILGARVHAAILEPKKANTYPVKPAGLNLATTEGKEWKKAHPVFLTQEEDDQIKGMTESVWSNPDAATLLKRAGHRECSAFALDTTTGVLMKCRYDLLPKDAPLIVDVKTTECARAYEWQRDCAKYGYHRQAAWYMGVRDILMPQSPTAFLFVVVEKNPPYECCVYQISEPSLEKGRTENTRLLWEYSECVKSGKWPGYFSGIKQFDLPRWALNDQPAQDEVIYTLQEA